MPVYAVPMEPNLILVHGAWHSGAGFDLLRDLLRNRGITSTAVELSSVGVSTEALGNLKSDAALVRAAVDAAQGDTYVLAHSYGGVPVTEGLAGAESVRGLIFLTSFVLDVGESLYAACGSVDPAWWRRSDDGERITADHPEQIFYNTCSPQVAQRVASQLRTQSVASFTDEVSACAWETIDSTYITCSQDQAIPLVAQEMMATRTRRVVGLESDHSPFLSQPETLANLLVDIIS